MADDTDLEGFDPYDELDREAARLFAHFGRLRGADWDEPTRCEGWSARDMLGHLRAGEDYHQVCVRGGVAAYLQAFVDRGARDVDGFNVRGIEDYAGSPASHVLDDWRRLSEDTNARFRAADGTDIDTSVGAYPCRWQAFHVASELATHADDVGATVRSDEAAARTAWRAAFSRFALKEAVEGSTADSDGTTTTFSVRGATGTVSDADFVELVMGRPPSDPSIGPEVRAALDTSP